jgi:hypothetical protein
VAPVMEALGHPGGERNAFHPRRLLVDSNTCAAHMLWGGADIRFIQQLLGHASLETTQIYTQLTIQQLREVHARCHPRGRRAAAAEAEPGLPAGNVPIRYEAMSTVAEIEAAIEKLPPAKVREVAAWLEEYQHLIGSSEGIFQMYDEEEKACRQQRGAKSG